MRWPRVCRSPALRASSACRTSMAISVMRCMAHRVLDEPVPGGDVARRGAGPQLGVAHDERWDDGRFHRRRAVTQRSSEPRRRACTRRSRGRCPSPPWAMTSPCQARKAISLGVALFPAARSAATTSEAAAAAPEPSPEPTGMSEAKDTSYPSWPVRLQDARQHVTDRCEEVLLCQGRRCSSWLFLSRSPSTFFLKSSSEARASLLVRSC